jgi:glycosyltransferase involved in cell wall biosynthesis
MKILQVAPHYYPNIGGVERHLQNLSETLVSLGHEVTVATTKLSGDAISEEVINGVIVSRFKPVGPAVYKYPIGLIRFLKHHHQEFDIVHGHNYHAMPMLMAIAVASRCCISPYYHVKSHSALADLFHLLYSPLVKYALRENKPMVINLSEGESQGFRDKFGIPQKDIQIIPSGLSLPEISCPQVRENGLVLSIGRLEEYKRNDKLIKALAYLESEYSLFIIGSGSQKRALEELTSRYNMEKRIGFLGRIHSDQEVARWYGKAEVFISLSESESFGLTVLESVAAGCKVICSDIPAYQELAAEFPGQIFPVSVLASPEEIAEEIVRSRESSVPPQADLKRYQWDNIARRHLEVYQSVIERCEG